MKLVLVTIGLLGLAFAGIAIKIWAKKDGKFAGTCASQSPFLNKDGEIVTGIILPTGAGAAMGAERALEEALKQAKLQREDIDAMVTTGYGRTAITDGDKSITEITCHARGAHFLNPEVRTVIDIGGQDSKVIRLDENGAVANFVMNDKCSAGTGKFLEIMANRLGVTIAELFDLAEQMKSETEKWKKYKLIVEIKKT